MAFAVLQSHHWQDPPEARLARSGDLVQGVVTGLDRGRSLDSMVVCLEAGLRPLIDRVREVVGDREQ